MIIRAAVKVLNKQTNEIITIPCHRHKDAYDILRLLRIPFQEIEEGFLNSSQVFLSREQAYEEAIIEEQISEKDDKRLFSEDLW